MRPEHFLANTANPRTVVHAINERPQVAAACVVFIGDPAPLEQHLRPFLAGKLIVALDLLASALVDDRPGEVAAVQRIADPQAPGSGHQLIRVAVEDLLRYQEPACRHAALAAGFERANDATGHRQVEAGIFADNDGALAAHFAGDDAIVMLRG